MSSAMTSGSHTASEFSKKTHSPFAASKPALLPRANPSFIANAKNEGFARGNNAGFEAAKGEWVFLLNSDAVCDPDVIAELMQFAADKPDVGQLACRIVRADQPNFFDSTGLLLYPDGVCRSRGWQEKNM